MLIDAQCGERYALRYNTVSILSDSYPIADMHGNYDYGGNTVWYSTMGGEFYGNNLNLGSHQANLFQQRGGKALWFFNNINSTGSVSGGQVSEERADSESPLVIHPERVLMQHVQDTYVWGNKKNYSTNLNWAGYSYDACTGIPCNPNCLQSDNACYNGLGQLSIQPNKQYWVYSASFNGTSGMGCGTLANRPLACTTGVAYWATDQSCDNLTGMVGANVSTPIYGTLYKCTSTDTWTFYYTPLQYPHPLRAESASDTTPPAAPTGVAVS